MKRKEVKGLIQEALENNLTPIVHPNGFIQLKLVDGRRLHFWHENIPRQKSPSPIHDHVFDMHSVVIAGEFLHAEIQVLEEEDGFYSIYEAKSVRDAETELVDTGRRAIANHHPWIRMKAGDQYDFPAGQFHETRDTLGPAISIITKGKEFDMNPCVLVPYGQKPDNDFTRDSFSVSTMLGMMEIITDRLLPRARPCLPTNA